MSSKNRIFNFQLGTITLQESYGQSAGFDCVLGAYGAHSSVIEHLIAMQELNPGFCMRTPSVRSERGFTEQRPRSQTNRFSDKRTRDNPSHVRHFRSNLSPFFTLLIYLPLKFSDRLPLAPSCGVRTSEAACSFDGLATGCPHPSLALPSVPERVFSKTLTFLNGRCF